MKAAGKREPPKVTKVLPCQKGIPSSREKIDRIQRGDDLTTDQQFLQIVAIAQFFVGQDAEPEVFGNGPGGVRFDDIRIEHTSLFSSARAKTLCGQSAVALRQAKMGGGVANGTRTRNSQNHNLELYH